MILTICVFVAFVPWVNCNIMSDITSSVLNGNLGHDLNLAAFGDYNSDKLVDIFVLSKKGTTLSLLVAQEKSNTAYKLLQLFNTTTAISSVVPGDYDDDAQMDVLITRNKGDNVEVEIYWGLDGESVDKKPTKVETKEGKSFKDEPLVLDYDGNMVPDIFGELSDGKRVWCRSNGTRSITFQDFPQGEWDGNAFLKPHSNSFVDITSDLASDLIITTENEFEAWINDDGTLVYNKSRKISLPKPQGADKVWYGQSVWVDIDQDSDPDLLLPVCTDATCKESYLYVYHDRKWTQLSEMFSDSSKNPYGYVTSNDNPAKDILDLEIPVTLHMGDFDTDGFPDILVLLKRADSDSASSSAYLLMNRECSSKECAPIGRTFSVLWTSEVSGLQGAIQATFFDIYEDGVLDIFIVVKSDKDITLRAYKNTYSADASFMKVTVVSGLCYSDCPKGKSPYGVNQPGVAVSYETTKPNGAPTKGCATQLSQSAHFALHKPYTIFGLGQQPNFVDSMSVGIPPPHRDDSKPRQELQRTWPQIIPNTQLIVIPNPRDNPRYWIMKLYVKPSEAIINTGIVILGCLVVVGAIVCGLHWRERKEDKEEKKQEAQKFHFDAM